MKIRHGEKLIYCIYEENILPDVPYIWQGATHIYRDQAITIGLLRKKTVVKPEDYRWSSYQTMIALKDGRITERNRTLAYFKDNSILRYRDFVEDIGHKYVVQEHEIKKSMEELPFD